MLTHDPLKKACKSMQNSAMKIAMLYLRVDTGILWIFLDLQLPCATCYVAYASPSKDQPTLSPRADRRDLWYAGAFFGSIVDRLQTRFYSISSSPKIAATSVHVTCSLVEHDTTTGRDHRGVVSHQLQRSVIQRLLIILPWLLSHRNNARVLGGKYADL